MTSYSKYNIVYRLQKWMDSVPGQTFLNYAYSWGASIVILGTLFKLTHLPGANLMLFFGMGTEVVVFFLSAFDRPFDKTADGMDLPSHVTPEYLEGKEGKDVDVEQSAQRRVAAVQRQPVGAPASGVAASVSGAAVSVGGVNTSGVAQVAPAASPVYTSPLLADAEVAEATSRYIDELNKLTETLEKVSQQSARLTRDSEEMENLNRTLTGIAKVYEMQLKGASQQIGTIDQINDQSRRMAQQIEQLNAIYARMIEAMTVNMKMQNP
ncbi:gliding motility protein GldL [Hoylesella loescheii]|jgi:gliding motility-associated protein gldL|uniref:type IX secretion system motor protein PorL/GldL n=1 Tax=Hoylesella loescheii TaxID=840 RepID=UPI0028E79D2F|nr:gliding motility protein GldL [Hoylesella loescheii]